MKKFPYVEDYLEIINGDRDPVSGKLLGLFSNTPPIVALARYDVKVLDSMSQSTQAGIALTDKQAELACKIILKYKKQLAGQSIDVSPVENPTFRLNIRHIDRTASIYIKDDLMCVKFPFQQKLVEEFKTTAKESQGRAVWNRDLRIWQLAITEFNINWAYSFAQTNNFIIDPAIQNLMDRILECEKIKYEITLTKNDEQLILTNAAKELVDYIDTHIGGLLDTNIVQLIDNSSILGYSVDQIFEEKLIEKTSPRIYNLITNRDSKFDIGDQKIIFNDIIRYADVTNRWPIYIYEPNLSYNLLKLGQEILGKENVYETKNKQLPDLDITGSRIVIYFTKYNSSWNQRIPLLISSNGMLYGGDKQLLLHNAEKIVYLAKEVYNNSERGAKTIAS